MNKKKRLAEKLAVRWLLVTYDIAILLAIHIFLLVICQSVPRLSVGSVYMEIILSVLCIFSVRIEMGVYKLIWRYGGIQSYIKLIMADVIGSSLYILAEKVLPIEHVTFDRILAICAMNLLGSLLIRMIYRYAYKFGGLQSARGRFLRGLLYIFSGDTVRSVGNPIQQHQSAVRIAIIGAGSVGIGLAEELINTSSVSYIPCCFVDVNKEKIGRTVFEIPVISEDDLVFDALHDMNIHDVVFAIPNLPETQRKTLYETYLNAGFRIKMYDYPVMQTADSKRQLREFAIEDLLFRKPIKINNDITKAYYKEKVILITGGGGSIGSELCRQLAKMKPKQIILLDIYENGVYDVQQELKLRYGSELDLRIEIASITHRMALERVFEDYHPDIIINAAAHKHVPLMEHNCIEAVYNNVFGTRNLVELCEQYEIGRFMMVSTDKAVNPTNVTMSLT